MRDAPRLHARRTRCYRPRVQFLANVPDDANGRSQLPRHRGLARIVLACCGVAVLAAAFPWTLIEAEHLFGCVTGPIAARTSPGFTCVTTCLLTSLLLLGEGRSDESRDAVRTASALLMAAALVVLVLHLADGPGLLRGVDAEFSAWFFAATLGAAGGALAAGRRLSPRART